MENDQKKTGSRKAPENSFGISRQAEEDYLKETLAVIHDNVESYGADVRKMQADIDEMLEHYHDNDVEVLTILNNTVTLHAHMKRALMRNEKAQNKPYFGRIIFRDESAGKEESLYIGRGGISRDTTHWMVVDWRAPVANVYYENGLGKCSYDAPGGAHVKVDLKRKRTYEIEGGKLLDYFDSEVIANDDLLTKYLAKNKQAVLGEIVATIQKEQNEIIRKSPYHNIIVQGVAGSGKTTVAMHRISYILYNYAERFRPDDFYIVGSNRILLNYITGVLPDLDVYGVRQMTMEQLFVRLLYEDWDEKKYRIKGTDSAGESGRGQEAGNAEGAGRQTERKRNTAESGERADAESIKGSLKWYKDLEDYCRKLERESIYRESIFLDTRQFVEGLKDGKSGVYDESGGTPPSPKDLVRLVDGEAVKRYVSQNPTISIQSKIDMLNERLINKIKEEFLGKGVKYTEAERKAILKAFRGRYGGKVWKRSIYDLYRDFLTRQGLKGYRVEIPEDAFDVYDLAALAYLYKRVKETEVISEAHHVVIDEAQDFGMMAYSVLKFCIRGCTYTVMGDVSQNIHFGYGLNDWEELKKLLLPDEMDSFGVLKKSYRNTVEISQFATKILHHGQFSVYPVEPIIRHGEPVKVEKMADRAGMLKEAAGICKQWQQEGLETIAVVCRNQETAARTAKELGTYLEVMESDPEKMEFGNGVMVLPVDLTKGLEFDAVLILDPNREEYPVDDGHAKLLYVAATRALHRLCVLHTGNLTGLIADPIPKEKQEALRRQAQGVQKTGDAAEKLGAEKKRIRAGIVMAGDAARPAGEKATAPDSRPSARRTADGRSSLQVRSVTTPTDHSARVPSPVRPSQPAVQIEPPEVTKVTAAAPDFGDMPANEQLRPAGHSRIDLSVKWVEKQPDGLALHSRYGALYLRPVAADIIRISFTKAGTVGRKSPQIAVSGQPCAWMYQSSGNKVDIMTDELRLSVDKTNGNIQYMTRNKKVLLTERGKECRQIEAGQDGTARAWMYFDWAKGEGLQGIGDGRKPVIDLNGSARYFSRGGRGGALPLLVSDKGYAIMMAQDDPTFCCNIPSYGSYVYTQSASQIDFYFMLSKAVGRIRLD